MTEPRADADPGRAAGPDPASLERRLGELTEVIAGRLHAGEVVLVEEYIARDPDLAEPLLRLVPAMRELIRVRRSRARDGGVRGPGP